MVLVQALLDIEMADDADACVLTYTVHKVIQA